ncbi:MAG: T9SS type A sorting domain-containing protein [Lewinellaceae bacterium]|nr:T9SS type A sorting domain-containing protein [Lewinellaceae bacterium]
MCGNSADCVQIITVNDQAPPTVSCLANVNVSCAADVPAPAPNSVTASDLCGGGVIVVHVSDVINAQTCANRYTITRTYRATDLCGNSATCAQTITVNDQTPPVISCLANVNISCAADVPAPAPNSVTASDLCGGGVTVVHVSDVINAQTCANRYTITRTYRATDLCGNSADCVQIITVNDQAPPVISCLANVNISCPGDVPAPAPNSVTASDLCGGGVTVMHLSDVINAQTCANRYTITRTYRATDLCGNSADCVQIITVNDQTPPTVSCLANVNVSCAADVPAPAPNSVTASDLCGGGVIVVHVSDVINAQTCANRYTITRTYRATDLCGNSADCVQIITVFDNTPPVLAGIPANITVECHAIPIPDNPTATYNRGGAVNITFTQLQPPGICPVAYVETRIWTATDLCGNIVVRTQTVSVVDTEAPVFTVNPHNVKCWYSCGPGNEADYQNWLDTQGGGTATDCSTITWTYINSPGYFPTEACGNTFYSYIRFIATDECGNSSYDDAFFMVTDTTPPVFTVLPQDIEVDCMADCNGEIDFYNWLDNLAGLQVEDSCGAVTLDWGLWSEGEGCGNTWWKTYYFTATDECGNVATKFATFAVVDHIPPTVQCPPGIDTLDCEYDLPAPDLSAVIATDNCGLVHVVLDNKFVYGTACSGWPQTVIYTYAAYDECGNSATCYTSFQIVDTLPPVYLGPDTIVVACAQDLPSSTEATQLLGNMMSDNCYEIICFWVSTPVTDSFSVTYILKAQDICVNGTDPFMVTFIATGDCKPLCTNGADIWGNENSSINGQPVQQVLDSLFTKFGSLTIGRANRTLNVTGAECIFELLPGTMDIADFTIGNFIANPLNGCNLPTNLANSDGSLANRMAAQTMTLQLNIWYNEAYNSRQLAYQLLSDLPLCLINKSVLNELPPNATVQDLLMMSNNYLAGVGYFSPALADALASSLEQVNIFWNDCQENNPCKPIASGGGHAKPHMLSNLQLAPNPVVDMVTITFESNISMEMHLRVVGIAGIVSETSIQAYNGYNTVSLSTRDFPAGVYAVIVMQDKTMQTVRMVKIKD